MAIDKLSKLACNLDKLGYFNLADGVDKIISKFATGIEGDVDPWTAATIFLNKNRSMAPWQLLIKHMDENVLKAILAHSFNDESVGSKYLERSLTDDKYTKNVEGEEHNLLTLLVQSFNMVRDAMFESPDVLRLKKWDRARAEIEAGKGRRLKYNFKNTLDSFSKFMGKENATMDDVKAVQQKLLDAGFTVNSGKRDSAGNEAPDGIYGAVTENAVDRLLYDMGVYFDFYEAVGEGTGPDMLMKKNEMEVDGAWHPAGEGSAESRFDLILKGYSGKTPALDESNETVSPSELQGSGEDPFREMNPLDEDEDEDVIEFSGDDSSSLLSEWVQSTWGKDYDYDDMRAQQRADIGRANSLSLNPVEKLKLRGLYKKVRDGSSSDDDIRKIMEMESRGARAGSLLERLYQGIDMTDTPQHMGAVRTEDEGVKTAEKYVEGLSAIYSVELGNGFRVKR